MHLADCLKSYISQGLQYVAAKCCVVLKYLEKPVWHAPCQAVAGRVFETLALVSGSICSSCNPNVYQASLLCQQTLQRSYLAAPPSWRLPSLLHFTKEQPSNRENTLSGPCLNKETQLRWCLYSERSLILQLNH